MREGGSRSHAQAQDGMGRFWIQGLFAALLALGVAGCNWSKPAITTTGPEPNAIVVVIKPDHSIADNQKSLHVSEKRRDVVQWHNTSQDRLLMVFQQTDEASMFPLGELVDAQKFSAPHPVNPICNCAGKKTVYTIMHQDSKTQQWVVDSGTPPTGPEVIVDD